MPAHPSPRGLRLSLLEDWVEEHQGCALAGIKLAHVAHSRGVWKNTMSKQVEVDEVFLEWWGCHGVEHLPIFAPSGVWDILRWAEF